MEIRVPWVIDLLEECSNRSGDRAQVALLVETPQGHVLRFAAAVKVSEDNRGRKAWVRDWSKPVPDAVLRNWAAGPDRVLTDEQEKPLRTMDAATERRLYPLHNAMSAKRDASGTKVRVLFSYDDWPRRKRGQSLGLAWLDGKKTFNDGTRTKVGRLFGDWTPEVARWLDSLHVEVIETAADSRDTAA